MEAQLKVEELIENQALTVTQDGDVTVYERSTLDENGEEFKEVLKVTEDDDDSVTVDGLIHSYHCHQPAIRKIFGGEKFPNVQVALAVFETIARRKDLDIEIARYCALAQSAVMGRFTPEKPESGDAGTVYYWEFLYELVHRGAVSVANLAPQELRILATHTNCDSMAIAYYLTWASLHAGYDVSRISSGEPVKRIIWRQVASSLGSAFYVGWVDGRYQPVVLRHDVFGTRESWEFTGGDFGLDEFIMGRTRPRGGYKNLSMVGHEWDDATQVLKDPPATVGLDKAQDEVLQWAKEERGGSRVVDPRWLPIAYEQVMDPVY